ncbi:MAG TPA: MerR family transcriptional regulator [Actinobacteria bacterium]|nr:hypothetical protein BMS3Bbin01_01349 [bacterium BMS3Bbin01]HDH25676.1 MerR family transcriptional regulator [Actinomycetota bacterium]
MSDHYLFAARTVRAVCRITCRQLDYWVTSGLIRPTSVSMIHNDRGVVVRSIRLFDFETLVEIRVIAHLRHAGVSLQQIRRVVSQLREKYGEGWGHAWLYTDGQRIYEADGSEALSELGLREGQMAFAAIAMERVRKDVARTLSRHPTYRFSGIGRIVPYESDPPARIASMGD